MPAIASHMDEYQRHLESAGMSSRTVDSYLWVARFFDEKYGEPRGDALAAYRSWLVGTYKPNTVNQRVQAINCYLSFLGREDLRLETVRVERTDEGSAIDYAAYRRLVRHLRDGGYRRDYHAVRLLATSDLRVGELLGLRVEDMRAGYAHVGSGKTARRVQFLEVVAKGALAWAEGEGRPSGPLFLNRFGGTITSRGLAYQLKQRAVECGVDDSLVHPQAFKDLFTRCFLQAAGDARFLDELLG